MPEENPDITTMRAVIAKAEELERNLPENPKQLIDTVVIEKSSMGEVRLIKDENHIKLALVKNGLVSGTDIAHKLDKGILVGIIGMSNQAWNKVLDRLPKFRENIDSESKKHS